MSGTGLGSIQLVSYRYIQVLSYKTWRERKKIRGEEGRQEELRGEERIMVMMGDDGGAEGRSIRVRGGGVCEVRERRGE